MSLIAAAWTLLATFVFAGAAASVVVVAGKIPNNGGGNFGNGGGFDFGNGGGNFGNQFNFKSGDTDTRVSASEATAAAATRGIFL